MFLKEIDILSDKILFSIDLAIGVIITLHFYIVRVESIELLQLLRQKLL
jgi:hypothetical protein